MHSSFECLNRAGFAGGSNFREGWSIMSKKTDKFSTEVREHAVRLVLAEVKAQAILIEKLRQQLAGQATRRARLIMTRPLRGSALLHHDVGHHETVAPTPQSASRIW
jgi:hypothetical protein